MKQLKRWIFQQVRALQWHLEDWTDIHLEWGDLLSSLPYSETIRLANSDANRLAGAVLEKYSEKSPYLDLVTEGQFSATPAEIKRIFTKRKIKSKRKVRKRKRKQSQVL